MVAMLNSKKLLYILPDVAYIAELLPTKQDHTFSVQSFRQINGEFLDDNLLIPENVDKLLSKLDKDTYHVILPDFIFTNTIVSITETNESEIVRYLKGSLFPELDISTQSHLIESFVLTKHRGVSMTQLSAIEKSVLTPLAQSAKLHKIDVAAVSPVSWTLKAVISLEPSISLVQLGSFLYSAQQYIGVDQTTMAPLSEITAIAETIKTLKGAEPSIQTVYLLTNSLVQEQLKSELSDTLPLQQLTELHDDSSKMPSFIRQIIEASAKTIDIDDFPVPTFDLEKVPTEPVATHSTPDTTSPEAPTESLPKAEIITLDLDADDTPATLPTPKPQPALDEPQNASLESTAASTTPHRPTSRPTHSQATHAHLTTPKNTKDEADSRETPEIKIVQTTKESEMPEKKSETESPKVIKNNTGVSNMLKTILITVGMFLVTIGIGVAAGITIFKPSSDTPSPSIESPAESPEATQEPEAAELPVDTTEAEATPTAEPEEAQAEEEAQAAETYDILVVNATAQAGYAGRIAAQLDGDAFGTITAGNAKGEYEPGFYILMAEENAAILSAVEEATGLSLTYDSDIATETTQASIDAVVVLAE